MRRAICLLGGLLLLVAGCSKEHGSLTDAGLDGGLGCDAELTATPPAVDFGGVAIQNVATQLVTLRNCTINDLVVTPAAILGPQSALFDLDRPVGSPFTVTANGSAELHVTYAPLVTSMQDEAVLPLVWSDGGTLQIPVRGEGLQNGLQVSPGSLAFGVVRANDAVTLPLTFTNVSTATINVPQTLNITNDETPPVFFLEPGSWAGGDLAPGESQQTPITFWPKGIGFNSGELFLDVAHTTGFVLTGYGGGPVISCMPLALDFGNVAAGIPATLPVTCANSGVDVPGQPLSQLMLGALLSDNPSFTAVVDPQSEYQGSDSQPVPSGHSVQIDVSYSSLQNGRDLGKLIIHSNATDGTTTMPPTIELSGEGACDLALVPTSIDFGQVPLGTTAMVGITVTNIGWNDCLLTSVGFSPTCSSAFAVPDAPSTPATLSTSGDGPNQDTFTVRVTFTPLDAGSYGCAFEVGGGAISPQTSVSVVGAGIE